MQKSIFAETFRVFFRSLAYGKTLIAITILLFVVNYFVSIIAMQPFQELKQNTTIEVQPLNTQPLDSNNEPVAPNNEPSAPNMSLPAPNSENNVSDQAVSPPLKSHRVNISHLPHLNPVVYAFQILLLMLSGCFMAVLVYFSYLNILKHGFNKTVQPSIKGFFRWFGFTLWQYIKPVLWNFIPFVGQFLYVRSLVHYTCVEPLATVSGPSSPMKSSWKIVSGNAWRIFGVLLASYAIMFVVSLGVTFIVSLLSFLIASKLGNTSVTALTIFVAYGVFMALFYRFNCALKCTILSVLSQEKAAAQVTAAN